MVNVQYSHYSLINKDLSNTQQLYNLVLQVYTLLHITVIFGASVEQKLFLKFLFLVWFFKGIDDRENVAKTVVKIWTVKS